MASRKRPSDTVVIGDNSTNNGINNNASSINNSHPNLTAAERYRGGKIKITIRQIYGVAQWTWNANDDVCGICQFAFEGTAPGVKYPGEDCPVVWGKCGHAFHLQCINKWLTQATSRNSCPICRQEWEFGQNPVNSSNSSTVTSGTSTTGTTVSA